MADLAEDFGEDAVLMAVWSAVSSWWRQEHNVWGHRHASVLHSDASARISGRDETFPTLSDDDRKSWHPQANAALTAWEEAGSPGLLDHIQTVRTWAAKFQNKD